jgi:hypothetical protein
MKLHLVVVGEEFHCSTPASELFVEHLLADVFLRSWIEYCDLAARPLHSGFWTAMRNESKDGSGTYLLPRARRPDGQILSHPRLLHGAQGTALSHLVFNLHRRFNESCKPSDGCSYLRHSMHAPLANKGALAVEAMPNETGIS